MSSTSGSITSASATGAYLELTSGLLVVSNTVTLTNVGTASGDLVVSLPSGFAASRIATTLARENATTGNVAFAYLGAGTAVHMYGGTLDNTSAWVTGYDWTFTIAIPT